MKTIQLAFSSKLAEGHAYPIDTDSYRNLGESLRHSRKSIVGFIVLWSSRSIYKSYKSSTFWRRV